MNLADAARLRYDKYWANSGGKTLGFVRHKTASRNRNASEVIFPLIEPLKNILRIIGNPKVRNTLVFNILPQQNTDEGTERRLIAQENANIRHRLARICEHLNMTQRPSPTWARHSFATNLSVREVPHSYISESMGHSGNSVTGRYISNFPYEKMIDYNNRLLETERNQLLRKIQTLDTATLQQIISLSSRR